MTSQWILKRLGPNYSEFQLDPNQEDVVIGRAVYPSVYVSRRHAIFHRSIVDGKNIRWMVEDLSGGRTFINGFQLTMNLKLAIKHGDIISLAINCKTEVKATKNPNLVVLKVNEFLTVDDCPNLPSPEDPPESDDFNSVESSKSDKSMIFESPQNSNQLSNIQMTKVEKTDEYVKKACLKRKCTILLQRLHVPMGSIRATIDQESVSWVEVERNTSRTTVVGLAAVSNIPDETKLCGHRDKELLQFPIEEKILSVEDEEEEDEVQIIFSSVDCFKTDVIAEEEEETYFSQFENIKSELISDDEILEIVSPASEHEDENFSDDDFITEVMEDLNASENSYTKNQVETTKRPFNFPDESDESTPTKLPRKNCFDPLSESHSDGEVLTSLNLPFNNIDEENFCRENEGIEFRKPKVPEKPVATITKLTTRQAIEIVPLPQPQRKAFLRGISEESVNQLISKNSIKEIRNSKNGCVSVETCKSHRARSKAKDFSSDRKEDFSDPNSIKEHRRKKLHEIALKKSTLNTEPLKKKQDRPTTVKIKVSEPKLSKFQEIEKPPAHRFSKNPQTTSKRSNLSEKPIAQKEVSKKTNIPTYRTKAETIRVEGGYAIKKLRFSNVISNVNSQDPTKVSLSKSSTQPKRFPWQTDLHQQPQQSSTSSNTTNSVSNGQDLEPVARKDPEKKRLNNTEIEENKRIAKYCQTAKPILKLNPQPNSPNIVSRVTFSDTTPQSSGQSKPVLNRNQKSSRLTESEANGQSRSAPTNRRSEIKKNEISQSGWYRARASLLRWNRLWFNEALAFKLKKAKKGKSDYVPEPKGVIGHDMCINPVSMVFANFKEYCNTFFPLMLHEMWATGLKSHEENLNFPKENFLVCIQEKPTHDGVLATLKLYSRIPNHVSKQQVPSMGWVVIIKLPWEGEESATSFTHVLGIVEDCRFEKVRPRDERLKTDHPDSRNSVLMSVTVLGRHVEKSLDKPFFVTPVFRIYNFFKMCKAIDMVRTLPLFRALLQPSKENFCLWKGDPRLSSNLAIGQTISLNYEQKLMVSMCSKNFSTDSGKPCVMVVQGPPGTGKSSTITQTILQVLSKLNPGDNIPKIIVCAPSNAAVDNLAIKVIQATTGKLFGGRKLNLLRIGDKLKFNPSVHSIALETLVEKRVKGEVRAISNLDSLELEMDQLKVEEARLQNEKMELSSNQSDNLLYERIKKNLAVCYSRRKKIEEKIKELTLNIDPKRRGKAYREIAEEADIVFSTLSSSMTGILEDLCKQSWSRRFSICFIDEASQCVEPEILIPLFLGFNKLVMVGDPAQLPATVLSRVSKKNGYEKSMMNRIYKFCQNNPEMNSAVLMLKTQYRMHPDILSLPGRMFYYGDLKTSDLIERDSCLRSYLVFNETSSKETANAQRSVCNEMEAKTVASITKAVFRATRDDKVIRSIGIITFYSRQKHTITKLLEDYNLENYVQVNTVDAFQGSECDVVIISCVRGRSSDSGTSIGFVSDEERINVALTRAKYALYIVGNFDILKANSKWSLLYEDAKLRSAVVRVQPSCDFGKIIKKLK